MKNAKIENLINLYPSLIKTSPYYTIYTCTLKVIHYEPLTDCTCT